MDNTRDLPGYKYYVDPESGERPAVFVTFVNVVEESGGAVAVNGVAFPVDADELELLDARERNYDRREVTGHVELDGRVWTYVGTDDARARYETGVARGTAVVSREYLRLVRAAFAALGDGQIAGFDRSTDPPTVPVRALRRVDLPG